MQQLLVVLLHLSLHSFGQMMRKKILGFDRRMPVTRGDSKHPQGQCKTDNFSVHHFANYPLP